MTMKKVNYITLVIGFLSMSLAFGDAKAKPKPKTKAAPAPMQVDEPSVKATPKRTKKISKTQKNRPRGLSAEQKLAFRVRKEKMQEMITLITEKRRAFQATKPEERALLAKELHSMILEREPEVAVTSQARVTPALKPVVATPPVKIPAPVLLESEPSKPSREEYLKAQHRRWLEQRVR
jgi:hypothetical protein